ncbi:MAG: SNF2 helicase associated domain-containing protein [Acholeplasmatales bacterium]|nr:SNF2 helicase associated domain-containing protein [Acholeplasmatales bacterium]
MSDYNFVFSMDYGIGLIIDESDGKYKIKYENKLEENAKEFSFQFIDEKLSDNLLNKKYESFFKYNYLNRGTDYANFGNVKNFYLLGDTIVGKVLGSNNNSYTQNIKYERGHFINSCTCPVGKGCKHVVAVITTISNIMESLVNSSKIDIRGSLYNILEKYKKQQSLADQLLVSMELKDEIKTIDDLEKVIKFIYDNRRRYNVELLIDAISYNNKNYSLLNLIDYDLKRDSFYNMIINQNKEINRILENDNIKESYLNMRKRAIYYVLNDEYYMAIKYILSYPYELKIFNKILPKLSINIESTEELINIFLDKYEYSYSYENDIIEFLNNLLKNANLDIKLKVYKIIGDSLNLKIDDIKSFTYDKQLELLKYVRNSNESIDYLGNNFNNFMNTNLKSFVSTIYNIYPYATKTKKRILEELLERIPDTKYVELLMIKKDIDIAIIYDFEEDVFFKYIDLDYEIKTRDIEIDIYVNLKLSEDKLCMLLIKDKAIYDVYSTYLYLDKKSEAVRKIIDRLYRNIDFLNELNIASDKIKEKRNKAKILDYNNKINELNNLLNFESYNENGLVTLRPEINYTFYDNSEYYFDSKNDITLELKIGRDKFYVLKSLPDLLDSIREHRNYKYGKNLEFYHYINNFDLNSRELIELLFLIEGKTEYSRYENPRFIPINGIVLEKIIDIYKDNKLIINGMEYNVLLNEIDLESNIESNYILNTNIDSKKAIFTSKNIYYLNDSNQSIYKIKTNDNNINLYEFLIKNNGMDVSLVLDKFKNDVYSRFSNEIVISNNLKDDFKLSELIIDAYFDFDGKAIIINPKIYKENEENFEMNIADKAKMDRFSNYINKLGFIDNKIIDEENIYNFLIMDFKELRELCNVYLSDSLKNKTMNKLSISNIRISYTNTVMNAFLEESIYTEEELYQILSAIKKRKKYVLLNDDRIIDINNKESEDFYDSINDLKLDIKHVLTKKQIPTYEALNALSYQNNISIDDYITNMVNELRNFKNTSYELPKINGELRKYQIEGFNFLKILSKYNLGGILADDMGLGKTLEIITLLLSDNLELPSLVVCPKSLIFNWLNEFEKFDGNTKVVCLVGNQNERHKIENNIKNEKVIYLIGYNTLSNDLNYLSNVNFNYIILDEAQYIKNVSANKTRSVKQLDGLHKFALTGTPIENNIIDLWSIFDFIMPNYLDSLDNFKSKYMASDKYVEKIKIKVSPFILRRKKEDVLKDLPPKIERIISVDMTNMQRKLYDAYKLEANNAMENGNGAFEMLPYITRLRQICIDPSTYLENYEGGSGKTSEVLDIIDEYISNGHRILIFSSFVQALKIIEYNLYNKNIKYYKITGETDSKERLDLVDSFNKNDTIKVFLISLKAGGTGLNLVGADTVIHLDPWWNVSAENQATDRAHRIGQTKTVEVIKIVCDESIEQRVIELQNIKKDLVDRVISKDDSSITGFTLEDINYILR